MHMETDNLGCKCYEAVKDEINRFLFNAKKNAGKFDALQDALKERGYKIKRLARDRYELIGQNHLRSGHQIRVRFTSSEGLVGSCLGSKNSPIAAA
jgi:hypothetical protein